MSQEQAATDLALLQHQESALKAEADAAHAAWQAAVRKYDRRTWPKLVVAFCLTPMIVVIVRLHIDAWGYYVAGAAFVGTALLMLYLDRAAVAEREQAHRHAQAAQLAHAEALKRLELAAE
jgi:hypothetical protein